MRRIALVVVALLAVAIAAGSAAAAQKLNPAKVAAALQQRHAFVQQGSKPPADRAALKAVAAQNPSFYLVVLARPLAGTSGAKTSARRLLEELKASDPNATVGLIVRGTLAGASLKYPQDRIAKAVADTGGVAKTDPTGALTGYTQAVSKPNLNPDDGGGSGGAGGRPFWQWLLLIAVAVGAALLLLRVRARSNEQRRRRRGGSIWTAREFHLDRLEALAARQAALTGETVGGSEDREAQDHLQTAGARILALRRTLPNLTSPRELRTVANELDAVEWEILWGEHRAADQAPPPPLERAFPGLCFFSHEHGLGTEPIELRKPDGTIATVWVSPENRLALERGDAPDVSMVHVGSRMVPWPTAPSWYGAYGWTADDLPGLEYGGQQIWGIDGPEREDLDEGEAPAVEAAQPEAGAAAGVAAAAETRDGELSSPDEAPGDAEPADDDATRAWADDDELAPADDPFAVPVPDDPFGAPAGAADSGESADEDAWAAPAAPSEPAEESGEHAPPPAPPTGFEELDEPAPRGLVEEAPESAGKPSEELFPAPPALPDPPELDDDEATIDGVRPAPPESTLEWDPFRDDDGTRR